MGHKYKNRAAELEKLTKMLRDIGIYGIEELSKSLINIIQGYARQIGIEPLTKYELEYVWQKLIF